MEFEWILMLRNFEMRLYGIEKHDPDQGERELFSLV